MPLKTRCVAHQTHGIGRGDLALFDADAGGDTDFRHLEGVQDGRGTRGDLDLGGLEHADTGSVELLEALVDDVVATDLDASRSAAERALPSGRTPKPMMMALERRPGRRRSR